MSRRRRRPKSTPAPVRSHQFTDAPVDPPPMPVGPAGVTPVALPGEALLHKGALLPPTPWPEPPAFDGGTIEVEPPLRPSGTYDDFVEEPSPAPAEGDALPALLPDRLLRWLDKSPQGPIGDLRNRLIEQGWQVVAPSRIAAVKAANGSDHWRAFPPDAAICGWPHVPLPATIDTPREMRNLVAALRRVGPLDWTEYRWPSTEAR